MKSPDLIRSCIVGLNFCFQNLLIPVVLHKFSFGFSLCRCWALFLGSLVGVLVPASCRGCFPHCRSQFAWEGLAHDFLAWIQCGFLRSCRSSIMCEQMHFVLVDLSWSMSRAPGPHSVQVLPSSAEVFISAPGECRAPAFPCAAKALWSFFCWNSSCLSLLLSVVRSSCSCEGVLSLAA
jgi:hypothetical protein